MIDRLSRFGAFINVVMPISVAGILTAVICAFTPVTRDLLMASPSSLHRRCYTASVGIPTFLVRGDVYFWGSMMAACLIASVPIAIIYNFFVARAPSSSARQSSVLRSGSR